MRNRVRKLYLNNIRPIGKSEYWFEDMASKGLHLESLGRIFAVFEKGEPLKTRYRVGVFYEAPSIEQLDDYKKQGWDLSAYRGDFYIFSSTEASDSPELYIDPVEQGSILEKQDKRFKNNMLINLIGAVFITGIMLSIFLLDKAPILSIVEGEYISLIFVVIVQIFLLFSEICNYAAFRALRKSLKEGKPINHSKDWGKGRILNGTAFVLIMAVALSLIVLPFIEVAKRRSHTLPEADGGLPIIRLSEIEQNPGLKRSIVYDIHGIDWNNKACYSWSPLAPMQYEVCEHGIISGQLWEDGSGEYSPVIETHYYRLALPKMANALVNALIDKHLYFTETPPKKIENSKFDALYTAEQNERKQIFAYTGDKVIYINYYGNKDMKNLIELLDTVVF